jgi:hypothetical protein
MVNAMRRQNGSMSSPGAVWQKFAINISEKANKSTLKVGYIPEDGKILREESILLLS